MPSGGKKREKGRLLTFPTVPRATRQIFLVGKIPLFAEKSAFRLCNADYPACKFAKFMVLKFYTVISIIIFVRGKHTGSTTLRKDK